MRTRSSTGSKHCWGQFKTWGELYDQHSD